MIRISTIFIAISMVLVASSLGALTYFFLGISKLAAAIVAIAMLTFLVLYHAVSTRIRDRGDVGAQIADLSRGTADLARQVGEFGRRLATVETQMTNAEKTSAARMEAGLAPLSGELAELGSLVRQLAASMAQHETLIAEAGSAHGAPPAAGRTPPAIVHSAMPAAAGPAATDPASLALMTIAIRNAVDANRIDLYLQPLITLPQRKVRFYEAVCRLRDDKGDVMTAANFIGPAESAGLMPRIDNAVLFRCVQVLRRLMVKNKDVGLFCNVATATLRDEIVFGQCLDFLDANRALASSLVLEFTLDALRTLSPAESEHLGMLVQRGFRISVDHVTDLRLEPRELADRGVRFVKVPASILLDQKRASMSDIHPADLSDLLGRFGIDLVAEKIESESAVVDLLDYDVRYGQGFLFAPPRLVRQEGGPDAEATKPEPAKTEPTRAVSPDSATSVEPNGTAAALSDGGAARVASGARAAIARGAAHRA
jgi:cyclic-di-GMP phosphodiesterase TipF (flagellum assembly factor)